MSEKWRNTGSPKYILYAASPDKKRSKYIVETQDDYDVNDVNLLYLANTLAEIAKEFIQEPFVHLYDRRGQYGISDGLFLAVKGIRYATEAEVYTIDKFLADGKARRLAEREKKEAAERKEFERLAKKYADQD